MARYVLSDQRRKKKQFVRTKEFGEELHAAKTCELNNRFQAAAATTNDYFIVAAISKLMSIHKKMAMNSDMSSRNDVPKMIQTLQKATKKENGVKMCSEGKK